MLKIAVICGGPSLERGISLNSARSILDHLPGEGIEISPIYVDQERHFYTLLPAQMYSNTPADFDFKLLHIAKKEGIETLPVLLKGFDLIFPVIHGAFGEDGQIQQMLEEWKIPYVGSNSKSCHEMFHKAKTFSFLKQNGFPIFPYTTVIKGENDHQRKIQSFFQEHQITRAIVKPESGGSSIGVSSVSTPEEALEKCLTIFSAQVDDCVLIEPFCKGIEFTVVVFENPFSQPVALIPTEIGMSYANHEIFDYRKKYLPTNATFYHTPPRFSEEMIEQIREEASRIFTLFGAKDFLRLDGWVMEDGTLYFTDLNPMSGMEQNSFLFRQASVLGLTHRQTLRYIVHNACRRYNLPFPYVDPEPSHQKDPIYVLFGGDNAERQVSLMSGTNVWLKLLQSNRYQPIPFLYDHQKDIWELPYSYTLNHTVEEVYTNCIGADKLHQKIFSISQPVQHQLGVEKQTLAKPTRLSLQQFISKAKENNAFVFIAMHGGEGEDGRLQTSLEKESVKFNGSNSEASSICMNKYTTGQLISTAKELDVYTLPKVNLPLSAYEEFHSENFVQLWEHFSRELGSNKLIIKPRQDGCSAGVVVLDNGRDLQTYCHFIHYNIGMIPSHTFPHQECPIDMPANHFGGFILEPFIETDLITIEKQHLKHIVRKGWMELTVGVLEEKGSYYALNPSITVAKSAVLTLEEKFQGGTGVNITPPPETIINSAQTHRIKKRIEKTAQRLKIQNYARIDIFFNHLTDQLIIIEANTLPALTASTVIYHQSLAENPPLTPREFLEKIISAKHR